MEKIMTDARLVKELRSITQGGFRDCRTGLDSTNGSMEEAIKILKEKGIAKAEKNQMQLQLKELLTLLLMEIKR